MELGSRVARKSGSEEDGEDSCGGLNTSVEVAGNFAGSTDAAAVIDRNLEYAEIVLGCADLHLEVPAIGQFRHM